MLSNTFVIHLKSVSTISYAEASKNNIPYVQRQNLVSVDLEMIRVEVNRKHSKPFLIGTWYRPLNSDIDIFNTLVKIFIFLNKNALKIV